jgi:uncharacterized protein (TIGR00369 family)
VGAAKVQHRSRAVSITRFATPARDGTSWLRRIRTPRPGRASPGVTLPLSRSPAAEMKPNPAYVSAVIESLRTAPYPAMIGMTIASLDFDRCRIELELRHDHLQPFGIVHGGVIATLIDTATFWAAFMRLPDDAGLVNVDLKLNYLKAVVDGHLRAEGECLRFGRQISYTVASVYNDANELVAHGTSTMMALPGKGLSIGIPKWIEA